MPQTTAVLGLSKCGINFSMASGASVVSASMAMVYSVETYSMPKFRAVALLPQFLGGRMTTMSGPQARATSPVLSVEQSSMTMMWSTCTDCACTLLIVSATNLPSLYAGMRTVSPPMSRGLSPSRMQGRTVGCTTALAGGGSSSMLLISLPTRTAGSAIDSFSELERFSSTLPVGGRIEESPGCSWVFSLGGGCVVGSALLLSDVKNMVGIDRRRSRRICHNHEPLRGSLSKSRRAATRERPSLGCSGRCDVHARRNTSGVSFELTCGAKASQDGVRAVACSTSVPDTQEPADCGSPALL